VPNTGFDKTYFDSSFFDQGANQYISEEKPLLGLLSDRLVGITKLPSILLGLISSRSKYLSRNIVTALLGLSSYARKGIFKVAINALDGLKSIQVKGKLIGHILLLGLSSLLSRKTNKIVIALFGFTSVRIKGITRRALSLLLGLISFARRGQFETFMSLLGLQIVKRFYIQKILRPLSGLSIIISKGIRKTSINTFNGLKSLISKGLYRSVLIALLGLKLVYLRGISKTIKSLLGVISIVRRDISKTSFVIVLGVSSVVVKSRHFIVNLGAKIVEFFF